MAQATGTTEADGPSPFKLLEELKLKYKLKNDRALAAKLEVSPVVISKVKHGKLGLSAAFIIRIHEAVGMPVKRIREISGQHDRFLSSAHADAAPQ